MHFRKFVFVGVLALALGAVTGRAQEWTRFRGPNGAGVARDSAKIPVAWTEKDFNWRIELPGIGHSSPVVWGDKVFFTAADPDTARRSVLCVSASDGKILWRRDFDSRAFRKHQLNSYATATPAVDAQRVYVSWSVPEEYALLALDHDGKDVWRRDLGPFVSQHGSGASPIVVDDLVILGDDQEGQKSSLAAFDARTGEPRWKYDRAKPTDKPMAAYSTPCLFQPRGKPAELIFASGNYGFTSLDPHTGAQNWELADAFDSRVVASPITDGETILGNCGEGANGHRLVAVRSASTPQIAYRLTESVPYVPTPLIFNGLLFVWTDGGTVTCARLATGEVVWREKVGGKFYSSPICVNGRLYCPTIDGEMVVLAASEKYQLLARNPLGEGTHATPAVSDGKMFVRTFRHLISLGGK